MILDLMKMPEQPMRNFKGGEGIAWVRMFNDEHNRIAIIRVQPGCSIGMHTHETSSEIIWFLSGSGKAICDGIEERVAPGGCHYCPKGHAHTLINDGSEDLTFFAVVPQQ